MPENVKVVKSAQDDVKAKLKPQSTGSSSAMKP